MALTKILEEGIKDGEIVNADINASAAIATSKITGLATSATTDTTNASNIGSGSLANARLTKPIDFADNEQARFGTGNDLQIYHNGNNSYVQDVGTGNLHLTSNGTAVSIDKGTSENMAVFNTDGSVDLYYDGSKKFETTNIGATVTGHLTTTGEIFAGDDVALADNKKITFGAGNDLKIYHDGTSNIITSANGNLFIQATSGENGITLLQNGGVELYYDNDKKFETRSNGIMARGSSGNVAVNIAVPDNISQSRIIFSDATNTDGVITYDHNDRKLHLGAGTTSHTDGDISITSGGSVVFGDSTATPASGQQVEIRRADNTVYSPSANRANGLNIYNASGVDGGYAGIMLGSTSSSGHYGSTQLKNVSVGNGYSSDFVVQTRTGGNYGERIRIQSAGGISFNGDTASANALDDYEEGNWTPVVTSGIDGGAQYTSNLGWYTKIGRFVHLSFYILFVNATTGSQGNGNSAVLGGIPFTVYNTSAYTSGGVIQYTSMSMSGSSQIALYTENNASSIWLYRDRNNSASWTTGANDNKAKTMYGMMTYVTAS